MRKIIFLTGTRADFGKLKSLISITDSDPEFDTHVFATGMHMHTKWGYTVDEIYKCGFSNIYSYINHTSEESMDLTLAKTIEGFSYYVNEIKPDLIIIHGDRLEALAGAIVGSLNNILVAHIEGGEVSGTIDELIRHSISKMSHVHFVANQDAAKRLIQMGEKESSVFVIGSPDVDLMFSSELPDISKAKSRYEINFEKYAIGMFHPVTTEIDEMKEYAYNLVNAILESKENYIMIYPNNDLGSTQIFEEFDRLRNKEHIKLFPSLRFEYFLVLLKNAEFIIGNSSAGIREAPYYGIPVVNIGTRQQNRNNHHDIVNCGYSKKEILKAIHECKKLTVEPVELFGIGNSNQQFLNIIQDKGFWGINKQKQFQDLV
jgi:UDP-N-acetylglucosamine 2-epimerase (hydrolysing)